MALDEFVVFLYLFGLDYRPLNLSFEPLDLFILKGLAANLFGCLFDAFRFLLKLFDFFGQLQVSSLFLLQTFQLLL